MPLYVGTTFASIFAYIHSSIVSGRRGRGG